MVYVGEDISSKLISDETLCIEGMFIELNFRKKKWFLQSLQKHHFRSSRNV